jgi:hypothetical protein
LSKHACIKAQNLSKASLEALGELEALGSVVGLDLSVVLLLRNNLIQGNQVVSDGVALGADRLRDDETQTLADTGDGEGSRRILALGVLDVGKRVVGGLSSGAALDGVLPGFHGVGLDDLEGVVAEGAVRNAAGGKVSNLKVGDS